ncbi:SMI1/KNR4 family protein [Bacillus sp. WMMC1349]|uniref:SMI1/KNR4 family protein n=1 Tax=Bacillus sp. WMMC1349 TaxID=2736254 RepID=UPI001551C67E|nr:SMI1/KNR4 family protein [Bacillus sp. WMMC1349]NPC91938.1 SMI1/KNR4 family protein [Bacillus sp. WMMC1349]
MNLLPEKLNAVLEDEIYKREDQNVVKEALKRLDVNVSDAFLEFYNLYAGPFWEENVPFELLDIINDKNNIESFTEIVRVEHHFPKNFLVLSEMSVNAILVLDTKTDKVYTVDFEGGDELLLKGELQETWPTFYELLKNYFNC